MGQNKQTPIRLLQTGDCDLTDKCDIAKAINTFFIERIEQLAASLDDETSQDVQSAVDKVVPQFSFTPCS